MPSSSPGFVVVDVDPKQGGEETLAMFEADNEPLPRTLQQDAPDGSRLIYMSGGLGVFNPYGLPEPPESRRQTPAFLVKLGAKTRQRTLGPGLWVHSTEPPSCWEVYKETDKIAREWASPHAAPTTAGNFEVLAMNAIHFHLAFHAIMDRRKLSREDWQNASDFMSAEFWRVCSTVDAFWEVYSKGPDDGPLGFEAFLPLWHSAGFPRLEVGHKLAAALCCTDVPADLEVHAPWPAWSLVVPDGLFAEWQLGRIWCTGTEWTAAIGKEGVAVRAPLPGQIINGTCEHGQRASMAPFITMIRNLIRGACLSISEPDEHRKKGAHGGSSSKNHRHGPPDLQQARFILSAPVVIDLREHVAGVSSGRTSTAPKVQFLVRGHWREQAHGPALQLRKRIWIQPFWKGPEAARVLLRSHTLKEN